MSFPAPPIPTSFDEELLRVQARYDSSDPELKLFEWLRAESGPEDWQRIAEAANWDSTEPQVFAWIASRPECDGATALLLFWLAQPHYLLRFNGDRNAMNDSQNPNYVSDRVIHYDMTNYIRDRWLRRKYENRRYKFDLDEYILPNEIYEADAKYGAIAKRDLPQSMRIDILGSEVSHASTIDGFPERLMQ